MGFSHPLWSNLIWAVPLLIMLFIFSLGEKKRRMAAFGDPKLVEALSASASRKKQAYKTALVVISILLIAISAAGPEIGTKMQEIKRRGVDIFIAIDCSRSMMAEDIAPSRLAKAKNELSSFVSKLQGDRIGVIAFAGIAFVQCPLTLDYNAAKMFLDLIDPGLIPRPGTNIPAAIRTAIKGFVSKEQKYKAFILLSDGESHEGSLDSVVAEAKKEGVRIYAIGFGNPSGEPIPVRDETGNVSGYLKDKKGESIMSSLNEAALQKIALETGGRYYRASDGEIEIERIYEDISNMEKKELQAKVYSQQENRYQYFLLIALILIMLELLLSEKKKVLIGFVFLLAILLPSSSGASLKGKIDKGNRLYEKEQYEEALDRYKDALVDHPGSDMLFFNSGDALFKSGEYGQALDEFMKANNSKDRSIQQKAYYNTGNSLYRTDRMQEAIQVYKKALDLNPRDMDAKFNLELLMKKMKETPNTKCCKPEKDKQEQKQKEQQQKTGDKNKNEKKEQQQKENKDSDQDKKEQQEQQQGEKKDQMSKEDAKRILDAFQESEMKASKDRKKMVPVRVGTVEKEW